MCVMASRTGAEWFVFDLARALLRRGHSVVVYAPIMGDMVEPLRELCVACVTDLSQVSDTPDLIIGHARDETATCLAWFPGVPAISFCHDRTAEHGRPPLFSRVRRYVAVDWNCAERLSQQHGIAADAIQIIFNGVDLDRFRARSPLPGRPRRALIFSNYATESPDTQAIRVACAQNGIEVDVMGSGVGRQSTAPELVLPTYDLVFAKARCAMEAMATGCAVILLNEGMGYAGLVTRSNVADWHRWNFGRRLMQAPIAAERIAQDVLAYDADDAQAVSAYVRVHLSLQKMLDDIEALAVEVVKAEPQLPAPSAVQEMREFARHVVDHRQPFGVVPVAVHAGEMMGNVEHSQMLLLNERERADVLQDQVKALHASWSWRVTAPLRWLGTHLGF